MKISISYAWVFFCLFSTSFNLGFAQTPMSEAIRKADVPPAWPDCEPKLTDCTKSRLAAFIAANLQTPMEANQQGVGGVVMVEFVVEKNGTIGEVHTLHDPGLGLGTEAMRVINLMKTKKMKWTPAEDNGKKVAFRYTTPVSFNAPIPPKEPDVIAVPEEDLPGHVYDIVEVMPSFAGCDPLKKDTIDCTFMKLVSHFKSGIVYPEEAIKNRVAGEVVIEFIIDSTGTVTQPLVIEGLGHGCNEEALRLSNNMPTWTPGMQNGKPVAVRMRVRVLFQLPKVKE